MDRGEKIMLSRKFKFIALLSLVAFLFVGIVTVQAVETYVDCGKTGNSRYSTITADDSYGQQSTEGSWRHTGSTVVYVSCSRYGEKNYKTLHSGNRYVWVNLERPTPIPHSHYATDHQE